MIKRRLKALKKADENKILKEYEGLYQRLVDENYSKSQLAPSFAQEKPKKASFMRWAVPAFSGALAVVVAAIALFPMSKKKNDTIPPMADEVIVENVSISTVESSLEKSHIAAEDLNFKSISASQTGEKENYFEIKVDTYHTFEMIVQINPDFELSTDIAVTDGERANINGFNVDYKVNKRRQEDYFLFKTNAVVDTGKEIYYIKYNYSSVNADCELLDIIDAFIQPK